MEAYRKGGKTMAMVADQFGVGVASIDRWLRLDREQGTLAAKEYRRGPAQKVGDAEWVVAERILRERPDITMQELAWELEEEIGLTVSRSTMQRTVRLRGWTRKKKHSAPKNSNSTVSRRSGASSRSGRDG